MESQNKASTNNGGIERGGREVAVANKREMRGWDFVLRFLALALCLTAAVVLGVDKQTKMVAFTLAPTLPPVNIPVSAKTSYLSAFVYFVAANAIACGHASFTLLLTLVKGTNKGTVAKMIIIFDLIMVALLFSSLGAATAVGLIGFQGNSHVQWKKVCNVFGKFCHHAAAAIGLSGVATFIFLVLVVLAILNLHKKH